MKGARPRAAAAAVAARARLEAEARLDAGPILKHLLSAAGGMASVACPL